MSAAHRKSRATTMAVRWSFFVTFFLPSCAAFRAVAVNRWQRIHRIGGDSSQDQRFCQPITTRLSVAVDPLHESRPTRIRSYNSHPNARTTPSLSSSSSKGGNRQHQRFPRNPNTNYSYNNKNRHYNSRSNAKSSRQQQRRRPRRDRLDAQSAEWIEQRFISAFDHFRITTAAKAQQQQQYQQNQQQVLVDFPTVRECNEAMACFGDAGDLLRSLRMFGRMRKLQYLRDNVLLRCSDENAQRSLSSLQLPVPSLVTYSTLMSRAVKLNKPRVALRLWNLMMTTTTSYSSGDTITTTTTTQDEAVTTTIVPDVKAANILMNCYAKLGDVTRAKQLLHEMKTGTTLDGSPPMLQARRAHQLQQQQQQQQQQSTSPGFTITPNAITINTLLNACQNAKDLDSAMQAKSEFDALWIRPDATSYTTLIATVARGPSQWSGQSDPSLAFELLKEMQEQYGITPNGMTYSALIDVCGRCRRSDLALQGLRIMLRQKSQQQQERELWLHHQGRSTTTATPYTLPNEVGAWTAAIDACGKAGRIETATKLFYAMSSNFGCEPNTVTCGCLTDCLLRAGRTAETLEILRYMKTKDLEPTEVMYTSLMTRADRLVQMEQSSIDSTTSSTSAQHEDDPMGSDETSGTKAIEVYTELMRSLVDKRPLRGGNNGKSSKSKASGVPTTSSATKDDHNSAVLMQVFLVFQQMKVSGATPDTACYNALLRACARAGDYHRAMEVMKELQSEQVLHDGDGPNDTSWRELLRVASHMSRSDLALKIWNEGLTYHDSNEQHAEESNSSGKSSPSVNHARMNRWIPSASSFAEFIHAFLKESKTVPSEKGEQKRRVLLEAIIEHYQSALRSENAGDDDSETNIMSLVDKDQLVDNERAMLLVLQTVVSLHDIYNVGSGSRSLTATTTKLIKRRQEMEEMAQSIVSLESLRDIRSKRLDWSSFQALERAESLNTMTTASHNL